MKTTVLLVEDDEALMTLLVYNLESEGYRVIQATGGEEAMVLAEEKDLDLAVLDWMVPQFSGLEICRRLRARRETANLPIIMLTARSEEADRVRGLDTGADDYITKPFSTLELMARIRALLRRMRPTTSEDLIDFGDIQLDRSCHRVRRGDRNIRLGPTEFRLLEFFLTHPGRVYSREQLLDAAWGSDVYVEDRTVDVHVGRLRKALNEPGEKDPIRTVRSAGYALDETYPASSKGA